MTHTAFALVIMAGLIHALWNIAAKKAGGDARFIGYASIITMLVWAPVGIYYGGDSIAQWSWKQWAFVAASGFIHVLYFVALLRGYRKSDLTVVYPMARGSGPLMSSLAAIAILGEHISALGLAGMMAVVIGVFLISGGRDLMRSAQNGGHSEIKRQLIHKGIFYGLVTGIFIASYTVLDGYAVKVVLISPPLLNYFSILFQVVFLLPLLLGDRPEALRQWRMQWKYAVIVAVVSPVSYVLVLYAMQTAPLSHVAPAREVSMLFAALIGGKLLGEGDRVMRIIGAVCIALGVVALGIGS